MEYTDIDSVGLCPGGGLRVPGDLKSRTGGQLAGKETSRAFALMSLAKWGVTICLVVTASSGAVSLWRSIGFLRSFGENHRAVFEVIAGLLGAVIGYAMRGQLVQPVQDKVEQERKP